MKAPMWLIFLYYLLLAVGFTVGAIQTWNGSSDSVWWVWGAIAVFMWYTTFRRAKTARTEGWTTKSIIIDQRAMSISRTSGYISFIYLMLFLLFSITGLLSWGFEDPLAYMIIGFVSAMFIFAVLQLIQLARG
jgi:hypothetical protein